MDVLLDYKAIRDILAMVNKEVSPVVEKTRKKIRVVIVGYSALFLGGIYSRQTEDIAIVNNRERVFLKHGFHVMDEHFFAFHPKYESRLTQIFKEWLFGKYGGKALNVILI